MIGEKDKNMIDSSLLAIQTFQQAKNSKHKILKLIQSFLMHMTKDFQRWVEHIFTEMRETK